MSLSTSSRGYIRAQITRIHNNIDTIKDKSKVEINSLKLKIDSYLVKLKEVNNVIQDQLWAGKADETVLNDEFSVCDQYFDKINEVLAVIESLKNSSPTSDQRKSLLKSPTIPLPSFGSNENECIDKFLVEFQNAISSFGYADREKLLLLKQQVTGRAACLLSSLELDKQKFSDAVQLLKDAFGLPDQQKFNTIKRLAELNLSYDSEPFSYISEVRNIIENIKVLHVEVEDFVRFYFWKGLNDTFKAQYVQVTNTVRPSLSELIDNFFAASERYAIQCNKFKNRKNDKPNKVTSLAINVNNSKSKSDSSKSPLSSKEKKYTNCVLCSENHYLSKCEKYKYPKAKLDRLTDLGRCTKCTYDGHAVTECRFKLKSSCFNCKGWHFTFLCNKESEKSPEVSEKTSACNTSIIVGSYSTFDCNSILPTFTFDLGNSCLFRGLKDNGSQSSFVSERLLKKCSYKILDNDVDLTIKGFNSSRKYETKTVEINCKFGNDYQTFEAVVVPHIDIELKLPGLSRIVEQFLAKGFKLADKFLNDCTNDIIGNFDLILGTSSVHCVADATVLFGEDPPAAYLNSPLGVMLIGKIDRIIKHLDKLSPCINCNLSSLESNFPTNNIKPIKDFEGDSVINSNLSSENCKKMVTSVTNISIDLNEPLSEKVLNKSTKEMLDRMCNLTLKYDLNSYENEVHEINENLVNFALSSCRRLSDGRMEFPILWNSGNSHLLSKNYNLAKAILNSNLKKMSKNRLHLDLMDEYFRDQLQEGVIERIDDLDKFMQLYPRCSFLPHMGVFRLKRETTKCRVVFLSNLFEANPSKNVVSHNQCIESGPSLNRKLSSSLLHYRFDTKLIIFDIKRAFSQISLNEMDQNRLAFLWFRNVQKNDFSIVGFKNLRLPFGLRCSPVILMLALFKMLVQDSSDDLIELRNLKLMIYNLIYMDNGGYSCNDSEQLFEAYDKLSAVFLDYQMELQQFYTNDVDLQSSIDKKLNLETSNEVKLLGLNWHRQRDVVFTCPINLDSNCDTKRRVLQSIAAQYDLFGFSCPLLNRARLFLHRLQCKKDLDWDSDLSSETVHEWKIICKQANASNVPEINRCVGDRNSLYRLVACVDASKEIYGVVVYIQDINTGQLSFIMSKNRLVSTQLETKSIPCLELLSISLGADLLVELYEELAGGDGIIPIKIQELYLCSDSFVALSWIQSFSIKYDKMQGKSIFIINRLKQIFKACQMFPISFRFIRGLNNPADFVTRPCSYNLLKKSNFHSGEGVSSLINDETNLIQFKLPCVDQPSENELIISTCNIVNVSVEHLIDPSKYSSFVYLVRIHALVLQCVNKWKLLINKGSKNDHDDFVSLAKFQIIKKEQEIKFPNVVKYFDLKCCNKNDIPNSVLQLNLFPDCNGIIRVKSKFGDSRSTRTHPILLDRSSDLTKLIVIEIHERIKHAGVYALLSELRNEFYISKFFSTVKGILKSCVICKRFNNRTIKLNQSNYRDFRISPEIKPFSYIYVDYCGPFYCKQINVKVKVYILCLTCIYTRAVNLKVCVDMTVQECLRALQLHVFQFGVPQLIMSDLGTQLIASGNIIMDFLSDPSTQLYLQENGIKSPEFQQYFKGCSQLGSLVEICVKMIKQLIYKSIKTNVLDFRDFEFLVSNIIHLINRRPLSFKESLRDDSGNFVPSPITPEILIHGYELVSLNLIPDYHVEPDLSNLTDKDFDPVAKIKQSHEKIIKVRANLSENYHKEFLTTLISQSTDKKDRYKPVEHNVVNTGDIVLIKDPNTKIVNYPMGRIKKVYRNKLDEVTNVEVIKGLTGETLKRHISCIIPLLSCSNEIKQKEFEPCTNNSGTDRPKRKSAQIARSKIKKSLE